MIFQLILSILFLVSAQNIIAGQTLSSIGTALVKEIKPISALNAIGGSTLKVVVPEIGALARSDSSTSNFYPRGISSTQEKNCSLLPDSIITDEETVRYRVEWSGEVFRGGLGMVINPQYFIAARTGEFFLHALYCARQFVDKGNYFTQKSNSRTINLADVQQKIAKEFAALSIKLIKTGIDFSHLCLRAPRTATNLLGKKLTSTLLSGDLAEKAEYVRFGVHQLALGIQTAWIMYLISKVPFLHKIFKTIPNHSILTWLPNLKKSFRRADEQQKPFVRTVTVRRAATTLEEA